MRTPVFFILSLFLSLTLAGEEANVCKNPRPEMCAQVYQPVCATLSDGSQKQYSNNCTACSDSNVETWIEGECLK